MAADMQMPLGGGTAVGSPVHSRSGAPDLAASGFTDGDCMLACDSCGQLVLLPSPEPDGRHHCPRCGELLRRDHDEPLTTPLALSIGAWLLGVITLASPLLSIRLLGRYRDSTPLSGARFFLEDGAAPLALLLVATVMMAPLLRLTLRIAVLSGLLMFRSPQRMAPRMVALLRWHDRLGAWCMPEIFLVGGIVAYVRLTTMADVQIGPAAYGLFAFVVTTLVADALFEPQSIWHALNAAEDPAPFLAGSPPQSCPYCRRSAFLPPGAPCPRCGTPLRSRKPDSVARSWALVTAAAIAYVPANLLPVMTLIRLGHAESHTIMGGVAAFAENGFWPLAVIVFVTSVLFPLLKLAGLSAMLLHVSRPSGDRAWIYTRLYSLIEALGRWSMIDVFIVAVLIGLLRFDAAASVVAGPGGVFFGAVVVLTMLAARAFDPRLLWDAGTGPAAVPSCGRR